jgi:hypothetical protein
VTDVLSIGYVTLLEAAEMLQPSMFAGVPDPAVVIRLRQTGVNVRDGLATDQAIAEIWKAVDSGTIRPMVVGGRRRRIVRLDPATTKQIPTLRSPRGRGFTFLRPSNPAFHQLAGWFGPDLSNIPGDRDSKIGAKTDTDAPAGIRWDKKAKRGVHRVRRLFGQSSVKLSNTENGIP